MYNAIRRHRKRIGGGCGNRNLFVDSLDAVSYCGHLRSYLSLTRSLVSAVQSASVLSNEMYRLSSSDRICIVSVHQRHTSSSSSSLPSSSRVDKRNFNSYGLLTARTFMRDNKDHKNQNDRNAKMSIHADTRHSYRPIYTKNITINII